MAKYTKPSKREEESEEVNSGREVGALVRRMEDKYVTGNTTISKYVQESMYENINTIDAYMKSKHISGLTDSLGREKPFFNIVIASRNIWYRATDIDRKNIRIPAKKLANTIASFLATVVLQDWMRKVNFGKILNEWGLALATYGSAVMKFIEQDGELIARVVPWNTMICDDIDFENNPKIEMLELTKAQLYKRKGYDKEMVASLIEAHNAAQSRTTIGKDQKDNKNDYIKVYEIHGELPLSYITDDEADENEYVQQMHVISFVAKKDGKYDDFTLYKGREKKDPYYISHLIKEDGQTLSIGSVQHLFDAQWMMNHTAKSIKDQLDLASKLIFQTSDGNFVGQNALSAIETGDILIHKTDQPLSQLNNASHDVTSLQNYGIMWKSLANEINGVSEAMMGAAPKSGTAWRQTEALLQESYSLFELMTENKGLALEDMMRIHILPFIKTQLDTNEEVSAILAAHDITKIDAMYIKNKATKNTNRKLLDMVLNGDMPMKADQSKIMQDESKGYQDLLNQLGEQRFFTPDEIDWATELKNLEWDVEVDVTGESANDKEDLATLTTVFQTIADPIKRQVLQTPEGKFLLNKILTKTSALTPVEMPAISAPVASPVAPAAPVAAT